MATIAEKGLAKDGVDAQRGRAFGLDSGKTRLTSATSSSKTTNPTRAMDRSLRPATVRTKKIWARLNELFVEEQKKRRA